MEQQLTERVNFVILTIIAEAKQNMQVFQVTVKVTNNEYIYVTMIQFQITSQRYLV